MSDQTTLLAHLVPRMTSRIEDTATDALAFILNRSGDCQEAFNRMFREAGFEIEPLVRFQTQVTYEDGSRPDMDGYDKAGAKRLLVESKFWATLLQGQASSYFEQLKEDGPALLLFIAPESRLITLWAEIERQMTDAGKQLIPIDTHDSMRKARVADSERGLMLVSWSQLLRHLGDSASGDSQAVSDIQQLRGLAQRQDDEAFQPIHSGELAPALPRRMRGINRLIDQVIRQGRREIGITTANLRATPQRDGYGRYFRFTNTQGDLFLGVNFRLWSTRGDTPLWLWISGSVPVDVDRLREKVSQPEQNEGGRPSYIPLHLKTGVEHQAVLDDIIRQLKEVKDTITN